MRIAIAGAGNVGRSIATELVDNGHQVMLIDRDPDCIRPGSIPRAEWLQGDACEVDFLDSAGLQSCQVVVAATGDDKANLVLSLLAKTEYGVPRVVARVNHPKNEWMFDEAWGVDVAVSTPRLMTALIEEAVSVGVGTGRARQGVGALPGVRQAVVVGVGRGGRGGRSQQAGHEQDGRRRDPRVTMPSASPAPTSPIVGASARNVSVNGTTAPRTKFGTVVVTVARKLVPNCSDATVMKIDQ